METNLRAQALTLEEEFFLRENQRLMESLREMRVLEETTGMLAEVSGITDSQVLLRLAQLKVTPAAAASLAIFPLVAVAWADGQVDAVERKVLLESLDKGLFFQTIDRDIVEVWLSQKPPVSLMEAWEAYARSVQGQMEPSQRQALSQEILSHAQAVAKAAGQFLGFGGVSPAEKAVLDRIEKALR